MRHFASTYNINKKLKNKIKKIYTHQDDTKYSMPKIIKKSNNEYIYVKNNKKYTVKCFSNNDQDLMQLPIYYSSRWFVNGVHLADIIANHKICEDTMITYNDDENLSKALNAIMS